jgi:hypothetical protein
MHTALRGLALLSVSAMFAQAPATVEQQPAGMIASWEIAPALKEIAAHAQRLTAALDKLDPQAWVEKGASDTYVAQFKSSRDQAHALLDGATALAKNPEKLSASLEVLFRIQGLESMVPSLAEAIRKYQDPAEAQALLGLAAENGANRERLKAYIVNLAAEREQDLVVMDREAQRCRGMVIQAPPQKSGRKK